MKQAKTALVIVTLLLINFFAEAQKDHAHTEEYCMLLATQKFMSTKVTISIDYGEAFSPWKDARERDSTTGKIAVYNSVIDALNYMNGKGWKFVNAYVITLGSQNVYHYLMRRDIE